MEVNLAKKVTLTEKILLGRNGKVLHYIVKKYNVFFMFTSHVCLLERHESTLLYQMSSWITLAV